MNVVLGADHGGVILKDAIAEHLRALGHDVTDVGTHGTVSVDYPDIGREVALAVASERFERGILVCGTGQGMAMTANKVSGVRAAVVADTFSAQMAMGHNNARVLCLGQRVLGAGLALRLVDVWMTAEFEGGRHGRRVSKMEPGTEET